MDDLLLLQHTLGQDHFTVKEVVLDGVFMVAIKTNGRAIPKAFVAKWEKALGQAGAKLDEACGSDNGETTTRRYEVPVLRDTIFLITTAKKLWKTDYLSAKITVSTTYEVTQ